MTLYPGGLAIVRQTTLKQEWWHGNYTEQSKELRIETVSSKWNSSEMLPILYWFEPFSMISLQNSFDSKKVADIRKSTSKLQKTLCIYSIESCRNYSLQNLGTNEYVYRSLIFVLYGDTKKSCTPEQWNY